MTDRSNGMMLEKRKRRNTYSSDEDHEGSYDTYFSEEQYRAMLGEHVHKYKRRHKSNNLPASASTRNGMSGMEIISHGSKDHKSLNGRSRGGHKEAGFAAEYNMERFVLC